MNLQDALIFRDEKLAIGFKSDGCTGAPDLGIYDICVMHDALKSFRVVTPLRADNLFFQGICTKGVRYYPIAVIYWLGVRILSILKGK